MLPFPLPYRFTLTGADGNVETYNLRADILLSFEIGGSERETRAILVGEATGSYISYVDSDGELGMLPASFPAGAKVEEFDACTGTASLSLDRFYAVAETYISPNCGPASVSSGMYGWMAVWDANRDKGSYVFDLEVIKTASAVDMTLSGAQGAYAGTLDITLFHDPS